MDGLDLLSSLASRLGYKPGHVFGVKAADAEHAMISLGSRSLPDAAQVHPAVAITVFERVALKTIETPADALRAFALLVAKFELHEAAEFFRVDGRSVFLPHRAGAERGEFGWEQFTGLAGVHLRALAEHLAGPPPPDSAAQRAAPLRGGSSSLSKPQSP